jgi:hypothetical protein
MQRSIFTYLKVQHTFLINHFNIKKVNDPIFEKGAHIFNKNTNKKKSICTCLKEETIFLTNILSKNLDK